MNQIVLRVEGMSCAHCENRVVKALRALPGVREASASAEKNQVAVSGDGLDLEQLKAAIEDAGYDVVG